MKKKRLTYRILSIVLAVVLVVVSFTLLVVETSTNEDSNLLLFGFTSTI